MALPKGFETVRPELDTHVTFDTEHGRLYVSHGIVGKYDLQFGQRIGLAYNKQSRQILIDRLGSGFYLDKRGYVTSKAFSLTLERSSEAYKNVNVRYTLNVNLSDDRFLVLDEEFFEDN